MKNRRLQKLTEDQWREFAITMRSTLDTMRGMYYTLNLTVTVKESEVMRRSIRHLQTGWSRAEEICGQQHGYAFALSIFHGPDWTYLA